MTSQEKVGVVSGEGVSQRTFMSRRGLEFNRVLLGCVGRVERVERVGGMMVGLAWVRIGCGVIGGEERAVE